MGTKRCGMTGNYGTTGGWFVAVVAIGVACPMVCPDTTMAQDESPQSYEQSSSHEQSASRPQSRVLPHTESQTQPRSKSQPPQPSNGFADDKDTVESESAPPRVEPIDVRIEGKKESRSDRTADSVKVDRRTLLTNPNATMLEALSQQAADVYVSARGAGIHGVASGASGGIHIRGLGGSPNSQVVVVEDGAPDYQAIFGHPIPDAYQPFLLQEAMIVRGGDSVLYGTNAMGGAIVLKSRWRDDDGWELASDSSLGSYKTLRQSLAILAKQGRYDVAGGVFAFRTQGHRPGAGGTSAIGQAAVRARVGKGWSFTLGNKAMHLTGADPGPVTHPHENHYFDVWRDRLIVHADWHSANVTVSARPFVNVGRHVLYDGFLSTDVTGGMQVQSELRWGKSVAWLIGSSMDVAAANAQNRVSDEKFDVSSQTSSSWFQQLTLRPVQSLSLVAGARLVTSDTYDAVGLYKVGAHYSLGRGWYVRARVARNYRQPTLHELYLPFPVANPDLQPERSIGVDGGGGYASDRFELSVSGYRTRIDNLIKYFGVWPNAQIVNIDHYTPYGVEVSVAVRDIGPISVRAGGNWQHVGRYTKQNPSARALLSIVFSKQFGSWQFNTDLEGQWVHGIYMNNYSRDRIDDPVVLNLSVSAEHQIPSRSLAIEPYLLLRNLFDLEYAFVENYPMPGFNALGGLRVTL